MKSVSTHSTSKHSAVCSDIIVRGGDQTRLIFRPEIVDNPHNAAARVRGRFLYQKKARGDSWADFEKGPLTSLKKGEQFQLEIKSGELFSLLLQLRALYNLHRELGVPQGRRKFVLLEEQMARLVVASEPEFQRLLSEHSTDAVKVIQRALRWLAHSSAAAARFADEGTSLPEINALIGLANLRAVMKVWEQHLRNNDEAFWQDVFERHSYILSQLFAYPVAIIENKAYVGGKQLGNVGGQLVDFVGTVPSSGSAVLIEIKTPETPLLGREYRDNVYPISSELSGAIGQVLRYRETLLDNLDALTKGRPGVLSTAEPRCVVIAGNASRQLAERERKDSFERIRERFFGVTVVTYDELFERVAGLIRLLERPSP